MCCADTAAKKRSSLHKGRAPCRSERGRGYTSLEQIELFKIDERTVCVCYTRKTERFNYPEADGPVAINVEGLEHVVGVETGVCNSHEGWPLTNYAKTRAVI